MQFPRRHVFGDDFIDFTSLPARQDYRGCLPRVAKVDVKANRKARKWSHREQVGRILWGFAAPFFRLSPRPLWAWRRAMLRAFGATVGADVHVYPNVEITIPWNLHLGAGCAVGHKAILYALGPITVGPRATVSQYAHLCAGSHDWHQPDMPLTKPPIAIGADSWICADAFVGPNTVVGDGAIVGACAVVTKDVPVNSIVAGNPAQEIKKRFE